MKRKKHENGRVDREKRMGKFRENQSEEKEKEQIIEKEEYVCRKIWKFGKPGAEKKTEVEKSKTEIDEVKKHTNSSKTFKKRKPRESYRGKLSSRKQ